MKYNLSNKIDIQKSDKRYEYIKSKEKVIELKELKKKRTNDQNAYLHVLFNIYAIDGTCRNGEIISKKVYSINVKKAKQYLF